jgi:hypothetical protein
MRVNDGSALPGTQEYGWRAQWPFKAARTPGPAPRTDFYSQLGDGHFAIRSVSVS